MKEQEYKLKQGGYRESFRILWPIVLGQAAGALMLFVDRTMLSRYSDVAIQAALPAGILSFLIVSFFQAVVSYSGTFVAQFYGAKDDESSASALGQSVWLSLFSIPLMAIAVLPAHWAMDWSGHAAEVLASEKTYFNLLMLGAPALVLTGAVTGFFSGRGNTRIVMVSACAGNVLNIVLDWALIFGRLGAPEMGIAGAAWATVVSQYAALAIPAVWLLGEPLVNSAKRFREAFRFRADLALRIVRFGAPSGVQGCLDMATFVLFVMLTGRLTPLEFALSNIGFTVNHLVFAPIFGFGQAANILAGQYHGARNPVATARSCRSTLTMAVGYMLTTGALILAFHERLLSLFYGPDTAFAYGEFVDEGFRLLVIAVIWGIGDAFGYVVSGMLKGVGDTRFVMTFGVGLNLILWMPLFIAVMAFYPRAWALWLTVPVYQFTVSGFYFWRFRRGSWRDIKMI